MKIVMGSDHAGFALKEVLKAELQKQDVEVLDVGAYSEDSVDYPLIAQDAAKKILEEEALGILICGSGIGISISANKMPGIRAALCSEEYSARMARRHNNANVLCMGGRILGIELAKSVMQAFLEAEFEGGRHQRRVDLIHRFEG